MQSSHISPQSGNVVAPSQAKPNKLPQDTTDSSAEGRKLKGLKIGWALAAKRKKLANEKICITCGALFKRRGVRGRKARFCSIKCKGIGLRGIPVPQNQGANHYNFKGTFICGKRIGIHDKRARNRWRFRAHVIAELKLGRPLRKNEHVHHINGNTLDDRPENLQVLSQSEHMRWHALRRKRNPKTKKFSK